MVKNSGAYGLKVISRWYYFPGTPRPKNFMPQSCAPAPLIEICALTHRGKMRGETQDAFVAGAHAQPPPPPAETAIHDGAVPADGSPQARAHLEALDPAGILHLAIGSEAWAGLLAEHAAELAPLVTHRIPLREIDSAFRTAADKRSGAIKVVLTVAA